MMTIMMRKQIVILIMYAIEGYDEVMIIKSMMLTMKQMNYDV